jgi:DNA integrity scanning protein DisA with diadenylate cyclase activity
MHRITMVLSMTLKRRDYTGDLGTDKDKIKLNLKEIRGQVAYVFVII